MKAKGSPIRGSPRRSTIKLYGRRFVPFEQITPPEFVADETLLHPSDYEDTYTRSAETVERGAAQLAATPVRPFGFDELVELLWGEYDRERQRETLAHLEAKERAAIRKASGAAEKMYGADHGITPHARALAPFHSGIAEAIQKRDEEIRILRESAAVDASRKFWADVRAGVYGDQWSVELADEMDRRRGRPIERIPPPPPRAYPAEEFRRRLDYLRAAVSRAKRKEPDD